MIRPIIPLVMAALTMICAVGGVSAYPRPRSFHPGFAASRVPGSVRGRSIRCEDMASAAQSDAVRPDFTVQYGCIEHPEMMGGSLGVMLRGETATNSLP